MSAEDELAGDRPPSAQALRDAFQVALPYTVGIEDEVMLLDPRTHELIPRAPEALAQLPDDGRFKLEFPASQLEIVTSPRPTVAGAIKQLGEARLELASCLSETALPAAAGAHPFSPGAGELNRLAHYEHTISNYGPVAPRQLVCALQIHVSVGDPERTLAVYNAARSYLPLLAALAANAPFYEGQDTGLASVRPKLCELLPRQGVPPPIDSWEELARDLEWGAADGLFHPGAWWWELRPHRHFGTLEFRVPDGQSTVADAAAVAALAQSLVAWLDERHQAGELLGAAPAWRIAENRWSACHRGVDGAMADLVTGALRPTQDWLHELLDGLEPVAERLGCSPALAQARSLVERNPAIRQREVAAQGGVRALGPWLSERFLEPWPG